MRFARLLRTPAGIWDELKVLGRFRLGYRPRVCMDILLYRAMRVLELPRQNGARTVEMNDGTLLTYRLNRGDIQAIREIWRDEVYMPAPTVAQLRQIVDLGANIGFTSVYLARRLKNPEVIAVEPDPENVRILRRNLAQNRIQALVVQAAVGPRDGTAAFSRSRESNLGQLNPQGLENVTVLSMASLLDRAGTPVHDALLKLDIEGGEHELFAGDLSWLDHFRALMAEFHPPFDDAQRIVDRIEAGGLLLHRGLGRGHPSTYWIRDDRASE